MSETSAPRSLRVLITEADPEDARMLRVLLAASPACVATTALAVDLRAALERLDQEPFDAVLLDADLPDGPAAESVRVLQGRHPEVAVIVIAQSLDEQAEIETLRQGASDWLAKPAVEGDLLRRSILYAVERNRRALSDARASTIAASLAEGFAVYDATGRIVDMNEECASLYGVTRARAIGRRPTQRDLGVTFVKPNGEHALYWELPTVRAFLDARPSRNALLGIRRPDGSVRFARANAAPIFLPGAESPHQAVVTYADVTAEVEAERALAAHARQQAALASIAQTGATCSDLSELMEEAARLLGDALKIEYISVVEMPAGADGFVLRAVMGWPKAWIGKHAASSPDRLQAGYTFSRSEPVVVDNMETETRFAVGQHMRDEAIASGLSVVIPAGGRHFGVVGVHTGQPHEFSEGEIAFLRTFAATLGQAVRRYRADEALRRSEERLGQIIETARDAFISIDAQGAVVGWNRQAEEMFGWSAEEVAGRRLEELIIPPEHRAAHAEGLRLVGAGSDPPVVGRQIEIEALHRDGRIFPVELAISAQPVGDAYLFNAFIRDITERRRAEEALRREHARTQQLLESIASILIGVRPDGTIELWNRNAEQVFGISAADVLDRPLRDCRVGWDWERIDRGTTECCDDQAPARIENLRFTRQDGADGFLELTITPVGGNDEATSGLLFAGFDVTDRRLLEGQLVQAQKLESIGQLAAGIAHEINTPTQYVGDNMRFLGEAFQEISGVLARHTELLAACRSGRPTDQLLAEMDSAAGAADLPYLLDEIPRAIEQSLDGTSRVAKIVKAMKEFSHPATEEKVAADLNGAIESTVTVARNEWKYVAEMTLDFDPDLPPVPCLVAEFNQVVLNLVTNAAHAIAGVVGDGSEAKGAIRVSTSRDGEWVEIRVSDTGTGIPDEARPRIFDPFFTTKEVGKGTGQGLAISRSVVVDKHGGSIDFETESGHGTTFIIRLPLDNPGTAAA